jgi:16S rRNA (adenine1518-N6/adenine1519-N6)-dimethyltransferase
VRTRRQRLGQHFLRDPGIARAIAAALSGEPHRVLEIGPGHGALTRPLLKRFSTVRCIELDRRLAAALTGLLGNPAGLEVRCGDALEEDLDALAGDGPWQVAGNLPYSVATPVVRRLLPRRDLFTRLVVMVQLEVARRLVAPPGSSERGLLTLEAEAYARGELLFTVPPGRFSPPPKVLSGVVRLELRPPAVEQEALDRALALASTAFLHRRKKLANALGGRVAGEAAAACAAAGVDPGARPQELELASWLDLAKRLPPDATPPANGRPRRGGGR